MAMFQSRKRLTNSKKRLVKLPLQKKNCVPGLPVTAALQRRHPLPRNLTHSNQKGKSECTKPSSSLEIWGKTQKCASPQAGSLSRPYRSPRTAVITVRMVSRLRKPPGFALLSGGNRPSRATNSFTKEAKCWLKAVSYTHLRAHET